MSAPLQPGSLRQQRDPIAVIGGIARLHSQHEGRIQPAQRANTPDFPLPHAVNVTRWRLSENVQNNRGASL